MSEEKSLKAAEQAAVKVNAMLIASGRLRTSDLNKSQVKSAKSSSDLFVKKVVINDAPLSARNFLTRSSAQEEISKMSGAAVSTRGRFMTKEEVKSNSSSDRPLFLHIQGFKEQDVKVAVGRIMHIIMVHSRHQNSPHDQATANGSNEIIPTGPLQVTEAPVPMDTSGFIQFHTIKKKLDDYYRRLEREDYTIRTENKIFREKVFLPMRVDMNPAEVRNLLVGENNSNLNYIKNETGASILMRGIGSGFIEPTLGMEAQEPLHFYLEHPNESKFHETKELVVNLAQTILSQVHRELTAPQLQPQVQFAPAAQNPPMVAQAVLHHNLQQSIALNGQVTPQIVAPSPFPVTDGVPNLQPAIVAQHPPHITMQVSPFSVPLVMNAPQNNPVLQHPASHISEMPQTSLEPGTQLVSISVPSSVPGTDIITQQLVPTSMAPQLIHVPHEAHIVNSLEGPKVIGFSPSISAPNFINQSMPTRETQGSLVFTQPGPHQPMALTVSQAMVQSVMPPISQPIVQPLMQPVLQPVTVSASQTMSSCPPPVESKEPLHHKPLFQPPPIHVPLPPPPPVFNDSRGQKVMGTSTRPPDNQRHHLDAGSRDRHNVRPGQHGLNAGACGGLNPQNSAYDRMAPNSNWNINNSQRSNSPPRTSQLSEEYHADTSPSNLKGIPKPPIGVGGMIPWAQYAKGLGESPSQRTPDERRTPGRGGAEAGMLRDENLHSLGSSSSDRYSARGSCSSYFASDAKRRRAFGSKGDYGGRDENATNNHYESGFNGASNYHSHSSLRGRLPQNDPFRDDTNGLQRFDEPFQRYDYDALQYSSRDRSTSAFGGPKRDPLRSWGPGDSYGSWDDGRMRSSDYSSPRTPGGSFYGRNTKYNRPFQKQKFYNDNY